jgi:hypothetical protein
VGHRPAGEGPLRVELATGGLRAELASERTALLRTPAGETVLRYEGLAAADATGRALSARLVATGSALAIEVEDRGAAYPVTIDPLLVSQQAKLVHRTIEGVEANAWSGFSVAVDLDTALVGAPGDDLPVGIDGGSVYVFTRSGTTWTQQAVLVAGDGAEEDTFGQSVALAGDTALVGAYADDTLAGSDAGSAYVFVRSGTTWTQQQQLLAVGGAAGDTFGVSVSLSGDIALVGASGRDTFGGGGNAGAAYVFIRSGTTWTQQVELLAGDGFPDDRFGASVSLAGDTALVGSRFADMPAGSDCGAAYVFIRSGTIWTQQQKLLADDRAPADELGVSVSVSGNTALVGAWHADTPGGGDAGAAYAFTRSGTTWTQQQKLLAADDGAAGDSFGVSVSLSGDTSLVGVRLDDSPSAIDAGAAYVFTRVRTSWTQQEKLLASDRTGGSPYPSPATPPWWERGATTQPAATRPAEGSQHKAAFSDVFPPPGGWRTKPASAR